MLPTSTARLYANANANVNEIITKEKAISMSKTMSKFYKKPKPKPILTDLIGRSQLGKFFQKFLIG